MSDEEFFKPIPDSVYTQWQRELLKFSDNEIRGHLRLCFPVPPREGFDTQLNTVHFTCTVRALNLYAAVLHLLQNDFWEEAMALTRSLYEILLNLHEIHREMSNERDNETQAERYVRFAALQRYLAARTDLVHGVYPGDDATLKEELLRPFDDFWEKEFGDFRLPKPKAGAPWHKTWKQSWCGKNTLELAQGSGDGRLEEAYYSFFFRSSSLVHGTPYSVLSVGAAFPLLSEPEQGKQEEEIEKDRQRGWLNAWFCAAFFLIDIVEWTKNILVGFDPNWLNVQRRTIYGMRLKFPPPFPRL